MEPENKKADFTPLQEEYRRLDMLRANGNHRQILICCGLLFVVFMVFAGSMTLFGEPPFGAMTFWIICVIGALLTITAVYLKVVEDRNYSLRMQKFAAVNEFTFTARVDNSDVIGEASNLAKVHSYFKGVCDLDVVEGEHNGIPFKLGIHVAEYALPGGGWLRQNVAYLKVDVGKHFSSMLVVSGKVLPQSVVKRLSVQPQPVTTEFQKHFQVFALDNNEAWNRVIPEELQRNLLEIGEDLDIEIRDSSVIFYQRYKFNPKQIPRIFGLVDEFR